MKKNLIKNKTFIFSLLVILILLIIFDIFFIYWINFNINLTSLISLISILIALLGFFQNKENNLKQQQKWEDSQKPFFNMFLSKDKYSENNDISILNWRNESNNPIEELKVESNIFFFAKDTHGRPQDTKEKKLNFFGVNLQEKYFEDHENATVLKNTSVGDLGNTKLNFKFQLGFFNVSKISGVRLIGESREEFNKIFVVDYKGKVKSFYDLSDYNDFLEMMSKTKLEFHEHSLLKKYPETYSSVSKINNSNMNYSKNSNHRLDVLGEKSNVMNFIPQESRYLSYISEKLYDYKEQDLYNDISSKFSNDVDNQDLLLNSRHDLTNKKRNKIIEYIYGKS